jgi:uncharacterized protein HemX
MVEGVQQQAGTPAHQQQPHQQGAAADTAAALLLWAAAVDMGVAVVLQQRGVKGMRRRGVTRLVGRMQKPGDEQTSCCHCQLSHSAKQRKQQKKNGWQRGSCFWRRRHWCCCARAREGGVVSSIGVGVVSISSHPP